jgi:hypothetical protein
VKPDEEEGKTMTPELHDDELLRSYLLGKLPDEDADTLERRLLAEDELFDLAEAVELDLLAAVDRGAFTPEEKEEILRRLAATPRGRERLALARSLNALAAENAGHGNVKSFVRRASTFPPPAIHWIALAASLVMLAGLGWFAWQHRTQAPVAISQVGAQTPAITPHLHDPVASLAIPPQATPMPAKTPKSMPGRPAIEKAPTAVLALSFLTSRGAEERQRLELAPKIRRVEIQIDADGLGDAKSFDVEVRRKDQGTLIMEKKNLSPGTLSWGSGLVLQIPAERLPAGRYEIAVTPRGGEETVQEFEVIEGKH